MGGPLGPVADGVEVSTWWVRAGGGPRQSATSQEVSSGEDQRATEHEWPEDEQGMPGIAAVAVAASQLRDNREVDITPVGDETDAGQKQHARGSSSSGRFSAEHGSSEYHTRAPVRTGMTVWTRQWTGDRETGEVWET